MHEQIADYYGLPQNTFTQPANKSKTNENVLNIAQQQSGSRLHSHLPNGHKSNINKKRTTFCETIKLSCILPFLLVCIALIIQYHSYNAKN